MRVAKHVILRPVSRLRELLSPAPRPDPILFIHIAKTAGTSMRRMLQEEFGSRRVYPGDHYLRSLPHGMYPPCIDLLRDHARLPRHDVLVGHFSAAMADLLPRPYRTATFLREPVQRSLSMLGQHSRMWGVPVAALLDDPKFMNGNIADFQTRILGVDGACNPHEAGSIDDATLARALGRLEALDFVGLTERFVESCALFDARFGTSVSSRIRRDLVNRPDGTELSEHIPRVAALLDRDRVLYERAVACFGARIASARH